MIGNTSVVVVVIEKVCVFEHARDKYDAERNIVFRIEQNGFDGNLSYLHPPIRADMRFIPNPYGRAPTHAHTHIRWHTYIM